MMITLDDLKLIPCRCLACSDCDLTLFYEFEDLVISAHAPVEQREREYVAGFALLHRNLFRLDAEEIVSSGDFEDRAQLMSLNKVDLDCDRIRAIIDDIPKETPYRDIVASRYRSREIDRQKEEEPWKPRRRAKPKPWHPHTGTLFEDMGIYVPRPYLPDAPEDVKKRERDRKEKAAYNRRILFPDGDS